MDSIIITTILKGSHLTALDANIVRDSQYAWQKVRTDEKEEGWVAIEMNGVPNVSHNNPMQPTASAPTPSGSVDRWVNILGGLKLRKGPDINADYTDIITDGNHVTLIGAPGDPDVRGIIWVEVRTDSGQEGWVAAADRDGPNLSEINPNVASASPTMTATPASTLTPETTPLATVEVPHDLWVNEPDGVYLRDDARLSAQKIGGLKYNQHVIALPGRRKSAEDSFTWQQVKTDDGQSGWVDAEFLSPTPRLVSTPTLTPTP